MVTGTAKTAETLMSHFWEAILAMKVKFLWVTYVHLDYPQTGFRPNLRGSCACAKLRLTDMELPKCQYYNVMVVKTCKRRLYIYSYISRFIPNCATN